MKCPVDGVDLVMSERQGIEIDYCPQCRGVWLDRGELDKIIERTAPEDQPRQVRDDDDYRRDDRRGFDDRRHHDNDYRHHGKRHKKKSILGEIFDF